MVVCRNNPLYLSSGCIHAVVTLRGGFMYAGNFMTANNGTAFIRTLRLSPAFVDRYDDAGLRGLFANLLDQIDTTLGRFSCWHSLIAELIKSWPIIQRVGRKTERKRLAERLLRLSKETLYGLDNLQEVVGGATVTCTSSLCTRTCTTSHNTCTTFLC